MEPPGNIERSNYPGGILEIFNETFLSQRTKDLTMQILSELFLRPYLTSKELCRKFGIDKNELKIAYSFIRSSEQAKILFELSPYQHLAQVLQHLLRDRERTSRILAGETPFPLSETMELFISERCNAKCSFCYRAGRVYGKGRILSTQEYVKLINEFADLHGKYIDVCGGLEPLLGPSILDILKAGIDRNLRVSLYTNGIALNNPGIIDAIMKIHKVRISLNAYNRESYKNIMGVDKFDTVADNLRNIMATKKSSNSNVKIGISFVAFEENYKHILKMVKLAQEFGVDCLDLRSVEVTDFETFNGKQRKALKSILDQIRQKNLSKRYGKLNVNLGDTFGVVIDPENDPLKYLRKDFVNALRYFRVSVTPHGEIFGLNVVAQPSRNDERYLLGEIGQNSTLSDALSNRKNVPFESNLFLSHDISLLSALSKLQSDLEFGISLRESPYGWE